MKELEEMKKEAEEAGIEVLMGYNKVSYSCLLRLTFDEFGRCLMIYVLLLRCFLLKNVCKYVRKTREFAETVPGSHVTFVSNNAYE